MKLITIQDGISVNVHKIEAIEQIDDASCKVYVGTRTYLATFPYETLLQMLRNEELVDKGVTGDEKIKKTMLKLDRVLDNAQFFAG